LQPNMPPSRYSALTAAIELEAQALTKVLPSTMDSYGFL
jgi:hypothetical protein